LNPNNPKLKGSHKFLCGSLSKIGGPAGSRLPVQVLLALGLQPGLSPDPQAGTPGLPAVQFPP